MPIEQLVTHDPNELVWELRTSNGVIGRAEALDGETVWICRISVQPRHRGRGYATLLLQAVLDHCSDVTVGLAAAPLPTSKPGLDRAGLRAWYARHGFNPAPLREDPDRMLRTPSPTSGATPDCEHPNSCPPVSDRAKTGS